MAPHSKPFRTVWPFYRSDAFHVSIWHDTAVRCSSCHAPVNWQSIAQGGPVRSVTIWLHHIIIVRLANINGAKSIPSKVSNNINNTHACTHARTHAHTHTHARLTALCPGLPRWAGTRKVKPIWQSGFYWSKRQWVAVASAGPYASLHLAPNR